MIGTCSCKIYQYQYMCSRRKFFQKNQKIVQFNSVLIETAEANPKLEGLKIKIFNFCVLSQMLN